MAQAPLYLKGVNSVSVYNVGDKHVTIFGEIHSEANVAEPVCPQPSMSLATYLEFIHPPNDDGILLLELPPTLVANVFSGNINAIMDKRKEGLLGDIEGIDVRSQFINTGLLYNNHRRLIAMSLTDFMSQFFMMISVALNSLTKTIPKQMSVNDRTHLTKVLNDIGNDMNVINRYFKPQIDALINANQAATVQDMVNTQLTVNGYTLIDIIRHSWKKVTDFMVLKTIYTTPKRNVFILLGEMHAKNMEAVFKHFLQRMCASKRL